MLGKIKTWIHGHSLAAVAIAAFLGFVIGSGSGADSTELTAAQQRLQVIPTLESEKEALEDENVELEDENSELLDRLDDVESDLVNLEEKLTFVQSKRPMPDLVGASAAELQRLANRFGWTVTVVKQASSSPAGSIISQAPASGSTVHAGSAIKIVVAKPQPAPEPDPEPEVDPASSCDPNYSGTCVPQVSYDLNCDDIAGSVTVVGSDPHGFDADGDGSGCE